MDWRKSNWLWSERLAGSVRGRFCLLEGSGDEWKREAEREFFRAFSAVDFVGVSRGNIGGVDRLR